MAVSKVESFSLDTDAWPMRAEPAEDLLTRGFTAVAQVLAAYHRHRILHIERLGDLLEKGRPVILVSNHALSVIDPLLLLSEVYRRYGVMPRTLAHEAGWFRTPILRDVSARYGVVPSRAPESAAAALSESRFLFIFPGGASEAALRDYRAEPYKLKWSGRTGFLRLALEHDAELVFVAAVGNDDSYYQSRLQIPKRLLRYFDSSGGDRYFGTRVPLGPAGLPLPVQITHSIAPPLDLGDRKKALSNPTELAALHKRVWTECQTFLDDAVDVAHQSADLTDRAMREITGFLGRLGL